ncbi:hypothetical protein BpHYR1_035881 [Brachionus plicatilis]|uniref:Uncharacterized protein n=1 Tax=Brachionus plicatilis TaxID=10195 RepID=A0A3M7QVM1_BRAPC|nr:hypothetical protein BpHYR1_035881 [Brachionus plicatilis]
MASDILKYELFLFELMNEAQILLSFLTSCSFKSGGAFANKNIIKISLFIEKSFDIRSITKEPTRIGVRSNKKGETNFPGIDDKWGFVKDKIFLLGLMMS